MPIKFGKIFLFAIAVEFSAILVLVLLVALFGPSDQEGAQVFAELLGYWVGPIAGFVFTVTGGWLVARNLTAHQVMNGLVLGATVAAIDIAILVASGAEFQIIFVLSNIGRLVAGSLGGWLAIKRDAA